MCDESNLVDEDSAITRRGFAVATGVAALWPGMLEAKTAAKLKSADISIKTPDGEADCYFTHPAKGKYPAVLIWPDIWGVRPAFKQMADRLAAAGYAVLLVNPFYRSVKAPVLPMEKKSMPEGFAIVRPLAMSLTRTIIETDAKAFIGFLDKQRAVDTKRKMATTGYCMGGPITMVTAATVPTRVGAGASFHGGNLATDKPDSPHLLVPKMRAQYLFAVAEDDDQKVRQEKEMLRTAFAAAGLPAEIEVYTGTKHGWCPPDGKVYNEAQAEKAWARMLALFSRAL